MLSTHYQEKTVLSVSQLNAECKKTLESSFPLVWVEGEISNFINASSGHWYFTLKDNKSQIRCAMFRFKNSAIKFVPENGMQIVLRAKLSLYEPRGEYQLICEYMELAGDGKLLREYELLKQKLSKQGLFDQSHKKTLPEFPKTIGIISSSDGAAVHDILHVLKRRAPSLKVIIYHSQVQGKSAARQLRQALAFAQENSICDVLIIGRGGGSLEDLYAFNDEQLAHDMFNCSIPIVSAVGHEIDFSISDFVADVRASTPSSAAELVSQDEQQLLLGLAQIESRLIQLINNHIINRKNQLGWIEKQLKHPASKLDTLRQKLDDLSFRQNQAMVQIITRHKHAIELLLSRFKQYQPHNQLKQNQDKIQQIYQRLQSAIEHNLQEKQHKLNSTVEKLDILSPLSIMSRGYALITNEEKQQLVKSSAEVSSGELIKVRFAEDHLFARVIDKT